MLIGIAIEEGAIHSIDDAASAYAPSLTGGPGEMRLSLGSPKGQP
jgi:hypothetical protein